MWKRGRMRERKEFINVGSGEVEAGNMVKETGK
jgi:hypothetical protein